MIITYCIQLILIAISCYIVGHLVTKPLNSKAINNLSYYALFVKLLIGVIVIVTLISVVLTRGKTIFALVIPYAIGVYLLTKNISINNCTTTPTNNSLISLIGLVVIYLIRYIFFSNPTLSYDVPNADYCYYAKLSHTLLTTGIENTVLINPTGISPYHYLELWLNAGTAYLAHNNSLNHLMLITFSLLTFIVWVGLCAIAETMRIKNQLLIAGIALLGLFITGISFTIYENMGFLSGIYSFEVGDIWLSPKITMAYIILCATILQLLLNNKLVATTCVLLLIFVYTPIAPVAFIAAVLISSYELISGNKHHKIQALKALLLTIGTAICFACFYNYLQDNGAVSSSNIVHNLLINIRTKINIVGASTLQIAVFYALFIIVLVIGLWSLVLKYCYHNLVLFGSAWFVSGLFAWCCFTPLVDSVQLFSNSVIPLLNIGVFVGIIICLKSNRKYIVACLAAIVGINTFIKWHSITKFSSNTVYDLQYSILLKKLRTVNHLGVSFSSVNELKSVFNKNTNVYFAGAYLINTYEDAYSINLSVHSAVINSKSVLFEQEQNLIKGAPFYNYVQQQQLHGKFVSVAQSQLNFITDFNINYCIVKDTSLLPSTIKPFVSQVLYYKDDVFMFMNTPIKQK